MKPELACLVANAIFGYSLVSLEIIGKTRAAGLEWNKGNRDVTPPVPAWVERTGRALNNHKENFPLFLTAVLAVLLTNKTGTLSLWGSIVYVIARALHAVTYIAGVTGWRSALYLTGLGATFAVFAQLLVG